MFRDLLQKRLKEMEDKNPSSSLKNVKSTLRERFYFLKRYFSRAVEQISQKDALFGNKDDELIYFRQSQNFDDVSLYEKVRICKQSIEKTDYSDDMKDYLNTTLDEAAGGYNPGRKGYFEVLETEVTKIITDMIKQIFWEVAPVKARKQAIGYFKGARELWEEMSKKIEPREGFMNSLISLSAACDALIDSEGGEKANAELCKKIGDYFFISAGKLKEDGKKRESEFCVWYALHYYEEGSVSIPIDLKKNWEQYAYGETETLKKGWQSADNCLIELLPAPEDNN